MIEVYEPADVDGDDGEGTVRPGPLWRHAVWVAGMTVLAVGLGWAGALFRIGPEEYGLPPAAPGPVWPYLLAWGGIGLATTAVLRTTAARVPVYAPGRIAGILVFLGTRLSLGWRPEAPALAAMAAAVLVAAAAWCAIALRPGPRRPRGGEGAPGV
ncbi:hypothetical protein [Streptomyces sp. SP18CS02]|uniref:hypothetical protein n=1 Tax=Streptomyces sp. SP18CS02 TaxID=3002531 RepID=UPI002E791EC9|nr:hypothetical protein [Streptomyces sp. SP18CS02]MEE1751564.1 hypothetical protein [Streptomyces sp. SP18CS02]